MSRTRLFLLAIPLGALLVGPTVALAIIPARIVLDLISPRFVSSSAAIASLVWLTACRGVVAGLVAGAACGATGCRPRASAWAAGATALVLTGLPTASYMVRNGLGLAQYWRHACGPVIEAAVASAAAYLIACGVPPLVRAWDARAEARTPHPPPRRPPDYRYKL